ncbi:hypothetical protein V1511DRAFT_511986 [Dipodascopsis uninucleata]
MKLADDSSIVGLAFPDMAFAIKATKGEPLGLDSSSESAPWSDKKADIIKGFNDMVALLEK